MHGKPTVLATDLDGTLIPLNNEPLHLKDLQRLQQHFQSSDDTLVYVTGRHMESTRQAIADYDLPLPAWIICDVGTTILRSDNAGGFVHERAYHDLLSEIIATQSMEALRERLATVFGLRLQEPEKQGPFKLSFYTAGPDISVLAEQVEAVVRNRPFSVIASVDPFNGDGLLDLVPQHVSKAFALQWWSEATGNDPTKIIFAGDSGNDLAALTAGYLSIVVGNASSQVVEQAEAVHRKAGWHDRLYIADAHATSGVLEGCLHHRLL